MKRALLLTLLCFQANAATYYVDYDAGSDAAAGTSTGAAWKHCPGDANATGTAASTSLSAGDTVIFKGGVTYSSSGSAVITLSWSGSSGSPVTYDGNSAGSWGTGKAVITSGNNASVGMYASATRNHITIKNFHFKDIGGYDESDAVYSGPGITTTAPAGKGVQMLAGGTGIIIQDCLFDEIGGHVNNQYISVGTINGIGIYLVGVSDTLITGCEFTQMFAAMGFYATTTYTPVGGITVTNNLVHDYVIWGVDVSPMNNNVGIQDITITDNSFYNYSQMDFGNWLGDGEHPHRDGIFLRTALLTGTTWTNVVIKNNVWYDDAPASSAGGTSCIYISGGPSADIYNNLFLSDPQAYGTIAVSAGTLTPYQEVNVYNNTFVTDWVALNAVSGVTADVFTFKNNIVYNTAGTATGIALNMGTYVDCDYNLYFTDYATNSWYTTYTNASYKTFAQWQALGQDANSILVDPDLTSLSGNPSTWNAEPSTNSPAIDAGTDLSAYFTTDIAGTARPQNSVYDIGAYELDGAPDTTPPAFSSASVATDGTTLTVVFGEAAVVGSGGSGGMTISVDGGGAQTATYSSGSGTTSLVYTVPTVYSGETVTVSYTNPGDGLEDAAGNDVATISAESVTNSSTQTEAPAASGAGTLRAETVNIGAY